jgi:hypothetical protein
MARKQAKPAAVPSPLPSAEPIIIEAFGRPLQTSSSLVFGSNAPSAFNGNVRVMRFRITVEAIPEAPDVLAARIEEMYAKEENGHSRVSLVAFWRAARASVPGWPDREMKRS